MGKKTKATYFCADPPAEEMGGTASLSCFHKRTEILALLGKQSPRPLAPDWLMK